MARDAFAESSPRRVPVYIVALVAALLAGLAGYWLATARQDGNALPGPTSPEAGFARDMQVHHVQGVELAMLVRDRTDDPSMRRLAYDMATTQGHQAGQLYGWLAAWGLNQLGPEPPMAWMGHVGHGRDALMPGMATPEQMKQLEAASGIEAERLFLSLMITHHRGALEMSEAILERSTHPVVTAFARAVITSQQAEIDLMRKLLEARKEAS